MRSPLADGESAIFESLHRVCPKGRVAETLSRSFVAKLCRDRPFSRQLRQRVSPKIDDNVGNASFGEQALERCVALNFIVLVTLCFFFLSGADAAEFQVVTNDGFVLVEIPAGTFTMGTTEEQRDALIEQKVWTRFENCELPAHVVTISKPFFVGKNEVTQKQWEGVMEKNPSAFKGENLPVESVSWEAVQEFLKKVNEKSGSKYRLPTEAEWEYCCRSGGTNFFGLGTNHLPVSRDKLGEYAWYRPNSENRTHAVGEKKSNAWGLHDMHGNVWEWCQDWYRADYYSRAPAKDPINDTSSPERVFRGGSWFLEWRNLRAAFRSGNIPSFKSQYVGFRLVKEIEDQKVISP